MEHNINRYALTIELNYIIIYTADSFEEDPIVILPTHLTVHDTDVHKSVKDSIALVLAASVFPKPT